MEGTRRVTATIAASRATIDVGGMRVPRSQGPFPGRANAGNVQERKASRSAIVFRGGKCRADGLPDV